MQKGEMLAGVLLAALVSMTAVSAQDSTATPPPVTTTTISVDTMCGQLNASCSDCTSHAQCLWCPSKPVACLPYPVGSIIPHSSYCSLEDARWGVCWVNYKILLITMGCLAGVILISLLCCCYCCCCRSGGSSKKKNREEEAKLEEQKDQRRTKNDEKRKERQSKYDEIRRKYGITNRNEGLMKDDSGEQKKYQRFDNEA